MLGYIHRSVFTNTESEHTVLETCYVYVLTWKGTEPLFLVVYNSSNHCIRFTKLCSNLIFSSISILSVFSKPLEKLMHNRLLLFLKRHNILTCEKHGFMESKSTETASHSFIQCVQEALDRRLHAVGIFLDLSKACEVIHHNRSLDKLDSYGIRGSVNKWFQSYLTNRTQFF